MCWAGQSLCPLGGDLCALRAPGGHFWWLECLWDTVCRSEVGGEYLGCSGTPHPPQSPTAVSMHAPTAPTSGMQLCRAGPGYFLETSESGIPDLHCSLISFHRHITPVTEHLVLCPVSSSENREAAARSG